MESGIEIETEIEMEMEIEIEMESPRCTFMLSGMGGASSRPPP